jgi:hypothetical protein
MGAVRRIFAGFARNWRGVPLGQRRVWLAALGGALAVLVVMGALVVFGGAGPTTTPRAALVNPTASGAATGTDTATASATATHPRPTATKPVHAAPRPPAPPSPPTPPPVTPTVTFCPTATPAPTATSTATATATATATSAATATSTSRAVAYAAATCQQCPYYSGNNPSQAQIRAALDAAADQYRLPRNLLLAVAWQESRWHQDVLSCDGGIGLMQIQYYTAPWLDGQAVPDCHLGATSYDVNSLQGNADLGAKYLAWLSCYYSYWGYPPAGATTGTGPSNPTPYTIAWYYQQAGLQYPDAKNANGTQNPNSFCAAVFNDPANPEYAALPATTAQPWSCPYSATTGDATLLDITLSAYNEGAAYTDAHGIQNWWYVQGVEGWVPQFASGALP